LPPRLYTPVGVFFDLQQVSSGLRRLRSNLPDQLWERTAKILRLNLFEQIFEQIFFHKKFTFYCGKLHLKLICFYPRFSLCAYLFRKADAKVSTPDSFVQVFFKIFFIIYQNEPGV